MFCSITRYRLRDWSGEIREDDRRVERRSQTRSFVLAALIGSRGAHAPLAISILIKVVDSFSVVRAATSYGFLVNC